MQQGGAAPRKRKLRFFTASDMSTCPSQFASPRREQGGSGTSDEKPGSSVSARLTG